MEEWDWEKNNELGLDPSKLPVYSNSIKAFFKCRINPLHEWQTSLTNRSMGSGCPKCSKSRQISSQEVAVGKVLERIGLKVISRHKIDGLEFDACCDEPRLLIEYNGMAWHELEASDRDLLKYETSKAYNYDLIIIREFRNNLNSNDIDDIIVKKDDNNINTIYFNIGKNYEHLEELLNTLVNIVCKAYNICKVDINYSDIIRESRQYVGLKQQ